MPEGGNDRLLCNLSTTWLLWQVPLQVGECQWGRSALHPSTNICRYLWPVLSQVPLHYNTFPCFVTFPHLRTLVCISVPAPQKVAIFLICSAVDGRGRQQRTNTALRNICSISFQNYDDLGEKQDSSSYVLFMQQVYLEIFCKSMKLFRNHFCAKSHSLRASVVF